MLSGSQAIGYMKLVKGPLKNTGELNIAIGEKRQWGKGYGKDAIREFLKYCFFEEKLDKVIAYVADSNERAQKLFEKSGFTFEKTEETKKSDGTSCVMHRMVILKNGVSI